MFIYAIGTLPLICSLRDPGQWTQLWYADDGSTGGTLQELRNWFILLCSWVDYHLNLKNILLSLMINGKVKLLLIFGDLGVQVRFETG